MASETRNRQCWECFRRRLVCDFSRPGCKKCETVGTDCPGYSKHKPLKWLAPGEVASKKRGRVSNRERNIVDAGKRTTAAPNSIDNVKRELIERNTGIVFDTTIALAGLRLMDTCEDVEKTIPRLNLTDDTTEVVLSVHYCTENPR
jgi:hypothetical protein